MDNFVLLQQPRLPWIDVEAVKHAFLARAQEFHPDKFHNASEAEKTAAQNRYTDLNAAQKCLAEPKDRLRHLLELELGTQPADLKSVPNDLMDLWMETGQVCREADNFVKSRNETASPLLKAQFFQSGLVFVEKLNGLIRRIDLRRGELLAELRGMNEHWITAPPPGDPARKAALPLERLEQIHRILCYLERWLAQAREKSAQISF